MFTRQIKAGYFVLEGLNSFSTCLFFYYFYFFTAQEYGFGNKANLALAAMNGAVYAVCSLYGGKFAQRHGYLSALVLGLCLMLGAIGCSSQVHSASLHIGLMLVADMGMCFTWPALEAIICEGEDRAGLQQMIGTYNIVWATTGAIGYFLGGAILQTLGIRSMFYVPAGIIIVQLVLMFVLWQAAEQGSAGRFVSKSPPNPEPHPHPPAETERFVRMAWLANPAAYLSINTLVALMPGISGRLGLSTMLAGFCCSLWCFARLGAFAVLWKWGGWHYNFRWLAGSYLALISSFAIILLVPNLAMLVSVQVAFGWATGLIYYSSLFYSMDKSETKGEHGGIHEAAIGLGNFSGPALGAASLQFLPQYPNSGSIAVTFLLLAGFGGMVWIRARR